MSSDRTTLEGKDRAELTVIAQAMGAKVGSRMRKGQIIDLILGAGEDASDDTSTDATDDATASHDGGSDAAGQADDDVDDDADSDADDADDGESDDSDSGDDGDADEGSGSGSNDERRGRRNDRQDNKGRGSDNRGSDRASDRGSDTRGSDNRGSGNRGSESNDANGNGSNRGSDQQGGDQGDTGNKRRRRRRGRDRDELDWQGEPVQVEGHLDLRSDGYGFLRVEGGIPSRDDCYVPVKMVREFGLRSGDHLRGSSRPAARNEKNPALLTVDAVNERDPEEARNRPHFDELTPIFPDEPLKLERATTPADLTARVIDIVAPIGKGQRGLIVAPPKAGKTTVIKEIVRSIETNNPEVRLIVVLLDERPEEVTDMKRWLKNGEVVASTFDRPSDEHTVVAEMVIERARRMVESGDDVCIVMDGITRLARAYNLSGRFSGRTMSGGVDAGALYPAKKIFGSARNLEEGGSLTILATALVETGSRMDEVIFEEFKGTGNMELRLDRNASERRLFPAVDIAASSTRHDELLMDMKHHGATTKLRRVLDAVGTDGDKTAAALELLLDRVGSTKTNAEFLTEVAKSR